MNFLKVVKFDLMNILRNPMLLTMNTIFPLLLTGIMGLVTTGSFGAGDVSSFDYDGVTMIIFTSLLIAMTASNTFMEEKVKKGNARIVFAPVSKTEIYLSKLMSTYMMGTVSYNVIMLACQFILHINLGGSNLPYIMLLINLFVLFGSSLGTMFCCIFKSEEGANAIIPLVVMLFVFFGGLFFPVASLGKVVETLSVLSPVRWVTECAFQIIYDNDFGLFLPVIALVLLGSALCILICHITFKPEEYV